MSTHEAYQIHRQRHLRLHNSIDELAADYMVHTNHRLSTSTVMELLRWSHEQTEHPTDHEIMEHPYTENKGEAPTKTASDTGLTSNEEARKALAKAKAFDALDKAFDVHWCDEKCRVLYFYLNTVTGCPKLR